MCRGEEAAEFYALLIGHCYLNSWRLQMALAWDQNHKINGLKKWKGIPWASPFPVPPYPKLYLVPDFQAQIQSAFKNCCNCNWDFSSFLSFGLYKRWWLECLLDCLSFLHLICQQVCIYTRYLIRETFIYFFFCFVPTLLSSNSNFFSFFISFLEIFPTEKNENLWK